MNEIPDHDRGKPDSILLHEAFNKRLPVKVYAIGWKSYASRRH